VVLLEVQMHSKPGFTHRLSAQSFRFLQLHPKVQHLAVVVVVPHRRLNLGTARLPQQLQAFAIGVIWLSLEELGQQVDLDPLLALLTLPVRPEAELPASTQQILEHRPDLLSTVLTMVFERFPTLTPKEIMVIAGIPTDQLLHTRAAQDLLDRGRQEGEAQGEAKVTLRQLNRRCGPLSEATIARIQALPLKQLEVLAEALLDFSGPQDLTTWLAEHNG
jgi:predicted transposase YdaD